jgi:hypothetical protein
MYKMFIIIHKNWIIHSKPWDKMSWNTFNINVGINNTFCEPSLQKIRIKFFIPHSWWLF